MRGHRVVPLIHKNSASGRRAARRRDAGRAVAFGDSVEERALERDVVELRKGEIGRAHGERHVAREVIGHERRVSVDGERLEKGASAVARRRRRASPREALDAMAAVRRLARLGSLTTSVRRSVARR